MASWDKETSSLATEELRDHFNGRETDIYRGWVNIQQIHLTAKENEWLQVWEKEHVIYWV